MVSSYWVGIDSSYGAIVIMLSNSPSLVKVYCGNGGGGGGGM